MKNNNSYKDNDEIFISDIIKTLWRERILILSATITLGLLGFLYGFFQPQEFRTQITIKNIPIQQFDSYSFTNVKIFTNRGKNLTDKNDVKNNLINLNNLIYEQFIYNFNINFLSLDNLELFLEQSRDFDNFKRYLKSKNISAQQYFANGKLGEVEEKSIVIPNKYFLVFPKNLDGTTFFNNYSEFVKKKTITEIKKNLKLTIENNVNIYEDALRNAKIIELENSILKLSSGPSQMGDDSNNLFYKGSKILAQDISLLNKLLTKIDNEQFDYNHLSEKSSVMSKISNPLSTYFAIGLILGLLLSLVIIFFKNALNK